MAKRLQIERLSRKTSAGEVEELRFREGLNFVVGPPNVGKTQWVRMLDYVFADPEPFLNRFPAENFTHYESISTILTIGGEKFEVDRLLNERGLRTKVIVNGTPHDLKDFQHWMLEYLGFPLIRYPASRSALKRTWPELSFRDLYRHIYRQQRFWSDLADRQTPIESSACMLQFLGLASEVYGQNRELLRYHQEMADRHMTEIYACRMGLSILMGREHREAPSAEELETIDPGAIVSLLSSRVRPIDDFDNFATIERVANQGARLNELLQEKYEEGQWSERLRLAQVFSTWSQKSEELLKGHQRAIRGIEERLKFAGSSENFYDRVCTLANAMNAYLRSMKRADKSFWRHSDVQVTLERDGTDLRLKVGNIQWDRALGGTDSLLFLLAYHYGLLALGAHIGCNYPGFLVVDFPAYFRGQKVATIEGAVVRPFADLLEQEAFADCQVIFVGASFAGEERGNRIALDKPYLH